MTTPRAERVQEVFAEVVALSTADRGAYLADVCAGDIELQKEVEALLASYSEAGTFLNDPAVPMDEQLAADAGAGAPAISEGPGTRIGRYKLLQLIGEGGFGSVFMAEQKHPVRRQV